MTKPTPRLNKSRHASSALENNVLELSLDAMLEDEIVKLTMASDGVKPTEVLALREIVPLLARDAI